MNHEQSELDLDEELAQWLVESGRRRSEPRPLLAEPKASQAQRRAAPAARHWDRIFALAFLAVAYLMYFFADTLLQINGLHSLIVFVPAG